MCEIVIVEVISTTDNNDAVVAIHIRGTAIGCKKINVSVECEDYELTKTIDVDGDWEVDFSHEEGINCKCNTNITVIAKCDEDSYCNDRWEGLQPCEGTPTIECPEVYWTRMNVDGCSIHIEATVVHYSGEFSAELRNSSDDILASVSGSGSGETILSYEGESQSETFEVVIVTPDGCTGYRSIDIITNCDDCPDISFDYELSECNEDTCNLLVEATLNSSDSYTATLEDSSGVELDSTQEEITGEHILSHEGNYGMGSSPSFSVHISSPDGCSDSETTIDIPSPRIIRCPKLSGVSVEGCWPGNVTLQAEGTNLEYAESFDWDFGDGQNVSNGSVVSHDYLNDCPDEVCLVTLTIQNPDDCEPSEQTASVSVPKCSSPPPPPPPPPPTNCWIWFWINIGLFIGTAIFIFITLCMIEANALAAAAAIVSGGTLTAVWAALSVANIVMILISIALILITLISFISWIIFCAFSLAKDIACQMLTLLHEILLWLAGVSFFVAIVLTLSGMVGCAVGAYIDVGWFAFLNLITWKVGQHIGCFPRFFNRKDASIG